MADGAARLAEAATLLAAVIAAPDDDAPRLVYADWLTERGDPLGEFIRLQCRLAAEPDDANRRALRVAENKLLAAHAAAWLAPLYAALPPPLTYEAYGFVHARGFVAAAKLPLACVPQLAELTARAPLLRGLELVRGLRDDLMKVPSIAGLFAGDAWRRLAALDLSIGGAGNAAAREVAAAPQLAGLTSLGLHASLWGEAGAFYKVPAARLVLDDAGAAALAATPHLRGVTHLRLSENRITTAGLRAIANGAWRLVELDLGNNLIGAGDGDGDLIEAFSGPALAGLRVLSLRRAAIEPERLARLAGASVLPQLEDLDLESCNLGAAGTAAFCAALARPALRRLRLERNSLCDAGAKALAGCAALARLTELEAGHNRIGQKGGTALAESPYLAKLERLTLNEPRWKPEMAEVFAGSATLAGARIYLKGKLVARTTKPAKLAKPAKQPPAAKR